MAGVDGVKNSVGTDDDQLVVARGDDETVMAQVIGNPGGDQRVEFGFFEPKFDANLGGAVGVGDDSGPGK